jgi:hypothetical protein
MKQVSYKASEVWYQDALESDLWHNDRGLIVNTSALDEREAFFEVTRVAFNPAAPSNTNPFGQRAR